MILNHTPLLFYVKVSAGFKATKTAPLPDSRPLSILISESISERLSQTLAPSTGVPPCLLSG